MKPMVEIENRLKYLKRLLANAERQKLTKAAQFLQSHIWGIEFTKEELCSPRENNSSPFVIGRNDQLFIMIGDVKYPVELDATLAPGVVYLKTIDKFAEAGREI